MSELQLKSEYPVRARQVFDLLRKPAFQEALALRCGALEVQARIVHRQGDLRQIRIERSDPLGELAILPGIAKEVRSVVLQDWDLDRMECRWSRHLLDNGKNTTLEGNLRLEVLGRDTCRLLETTSITVKVPLFGRKLEQRWIERHKTDHAAQVGLMRQQLGTPEPPPAP
jgi:hypothetical protein